MANVDLETKKIVGAEEGTKTYLHEVGHLVFEDKCIWGNDIRANQILFPRYLLFSLGLYILYPSFYIKLFIIFFMVFSIFFELFEEVWCWNYASKELNKKRGVNVKRGKVL
jgi:hypothetical protein